MRRVLVAVTLLAGAASLGIAAGRSHPENPAEGRTLFATYCASCHGREARGDGPVASMLRGEPSDLTQLASKNGGMFPAERVRRMIDGREPYVRAHGNIEMPIWGDAFIRRDRLTDEAARERIDAIVQYLAAIQRRAG
jgi:mono/diheme cytochrome c family protein